MQITHATVAVGTDSGTGEIHKAEWNEDHTIVGGTFVNVQDAPYNAVGDDTADDTTAIQAAIDDWKETGATIFFPRGTYKITAQLDIDSTAMTGNLLFLGEGGGDDYPASVISQHTTNTTAFKSNNDQYFMAFEHLWIKGPGSASSGAGIWGLTRNIVTSSVRVDGFFYGIRIGNASYYARIYGSTIYNNASHGIWQENGSNNLIVMATRLTTNGGCGLLIEGSQSTKVIGGAVENNTSHGISVDKSGSQQTDGTYISGVYFENNGSASIKVGDTASARATTVIGCFFTSPQTGYFIDVEAADYMTIGSCDFLGSPGSGDIRLQSGITHAVQWNNRPSGVGNTYTTTPIILEDGAVSYATPAIVLGTAAAAGAATTVIRSDSTIAAFDATAPVTQAFSDSAATGSAAVAARRDHKHGMPADPGAGSAHYLTIASTHSTPLAFDDIVQSTAGDDFIYSS